MKFNSKHFEQARAYIEAAQFPEWVLGFKAILMGAPGSGKTSSIPTLLLAGLEVFVIFTEQGIGNLLKACAMHGVSEEDMKRLHYMYVKPGVTTFDQLIKSSKYVQTATEFGKMENTDRRNYGQFVEVIKACNNFVDQNGIAFGAVDDLRPHQVLVLDGMSNLAKMAMQVTVGAKPVKTLQEWGVAIETLENLENQITTINAPFVLLTHIEREIDEVSRNVYVTVAALGSKYPIRIGRNYQDVILCENKAKAFSWATTSKEAQLKGTYLPVDVGMEQDFRPLVCQWLSDNGLVKFI